MPDSQIKVTYVDHMGTDLSVVNAARVSFGKKSQWDNVDSMLEYPAIKPVLSERDERLIHYLAKQEHLSPFGHCFASFHVKAPVFVARQLVKHKFLRINEISRRYVDEEPEFYTPDTWRVRSEDKKQGSSDLTLDLSNVYMWCDEPQYGWDDYTVEDMFQEHMERVPLLYNRMVQLGVAPEQSRMVLPLSMMTEWYWSGSLDAFAAMCNLRLKDDTQYESRLVAQQISAKMGELFPVSWKALVNGA